MDGWWLETNTIEEYLGVWSSEAKSKLTELINEKGNHLHANRKQKF